MGNSCAGSREYYYSSSTKAKVYGSFTNKPCGSCQSHICVSNSDDDEIRAAGGVLYHSLNEYGYSKGQLVLVLVLVQMLVLVLVLVFVLLVLVPVLLVLVLVLVQMLVLVLVLEPVLLVFVLVPVLLVLVPVLLVLVFVVVSTYSSSVIRLAANALSNSAALILYTVTDCWSE